MPPASAAVGQNSWPHARLVLGKQQLFNFPVTHFSLCTSVAKIHSTTIKKVAYHANKSIGRPFSLLTSSCLNFLAYHANWFSPHFSRCISLSSVYERENRPDWKMKPEAMRSLSNVAVPTGNYRDFKVNNNKNKTSPIPSVFSLCYFRGHSPGF